MVEENIYCRTVVEHSQKQGHLGESRVDMTRLRVMLGEVERNGREGTQVQQTRGTR